MDIANVFRSGVTRNVRVLGWELSRRRMWRKYDDQDFHTNSGLDHDSQKNVDPCPARSRSMLRPGGCAMLIGSLNTWVIKRVNGP